MSPGFDAAAVLVRLAIIADWDDRLKREKRAGQGNSAKSGNREG
jgi:hypothetical protein